MLIVGKEGVFVTKNGAESWTRVAPLKPKERGFVFSPHWFGSYAWDPINNILVVGFNKGEQDRENGALLIFNRTDSGNVKPRAIIRGPKSGIIRINQMAVYPPKKLIVATMPGLVDQMEPPDAFLGIWTYDDNGDVPPKWKIPIGSKTTLRKPFGVVLNPKNKEVILSDMRLNSVLTFAVPEIF